MDGKDVIAMQIEEFHRFLLVIGNDSQCERSQGVWVIRLNGRGYTFHIGEQPLCFQ